MSTEREKTMEAKNVVIVGLGYVGLPLACLTAEKGHTVYGYARDAEKVEQINRKESPIEDARLSDWLKRVEITASTDPAILENGDIVIVAVPTPVDSGHMPDLGPVKDAVTKIREHLQPGQLIIIESTINPGVCEEVVLPILEGGGKKAGKDFFLAHCPERINPGDPKWNVRNIPRVVGGFDASSLEKAQAFYENVLEAPVHPMKSLKEAEAVKIVENSFRDVNIAFVNEIAKSFDTLGIDVLDVINGAKTKPFSFLAHYPSAGIGGHCIPVDPYYLIQRAKQSGFTHEFLQLARDINNSMPAYAVGKLLHAMNDAGKPVKGNTVGLLGIAYKADIDDDRESPYYDIRAEVERLGGTVESFDPHLLKKSSVSSLEELLKKSDALILVTNHKEFLALTPELLKKNGILAIVDGKNALAKEAFFAAGIQYQGIGR
jgi:nucleotide sugar dehydrogenase